MKPGFVWTFIFYGLCMLYSVPLFPSGNSGWGVAPVAAPYYTPDTEWGLGAYVVAYYKPDENASFTKPDEYTLYAAYTQLGQVTLGFLPEVYLNSGLFKLSVKSEYNRYPSSFWGLGPETDDSAEESYTPVEYWGDIAFLIKMGRSLYAGPMYHMRHCSITETEDGSVLGTGAITGSGESFESGCGLSFQSDTRDSIFYPRRGFFIRGKSSFQNKKAGSDNNFGRHELDARFFLGIEGDHVIAFQFRSKISHGDVPLRSLCGIGGNEIMRGYPANRYLDRTSVASQVEYRFPLAWRMAGVFNFSAGEVEPSLKEYDTADIHFAAGTGLRVIIDTDEHIAGRIDIGVDEAGSVSIYILVKEAF